MWNSICISPNSPTILMKRTASCHTPHFVHHTFLNSANRAQRVLFRGTHGLDPQSSAIPATPCSCAALCLASHMFPLTIPLNLTTLCQDTHPTSRRSELMFIEIASIALKLYCWTSQKLSTSHGDVVIRRCVRCFFVDTSATDVVCALSVSTMKVPLCDNNVDVFRSCVVVVELSN